VALLGTSADPPSCGHQALLEELLNHFPRVATWASDNPSKRHGAALEQRAALLAVLVRAIGNPRLELVQELSSPWAITTLQRAAQRWPREELVFVVGSDLAGQIPSWKEAEAVLRDLAIHGGGGGARPVEAQFPAEPEVTPSCRSGSLHLLSRHAIPRDPADH
jgi:nicotinate-nucleotide adenylyltransferase